MALVLRSPLLLRPFMVTSMTQVRGVRTRKDEKKWLTWPNDWLPFEWEKPEPQIGYFATGDPEERIKEDHKDTIKGEFRLGFEFLKDRDDIPESVKTLFSLENSAHHQITAFVRRKRNQQFMRHPLDNKSHEVLIANYTSKIRQMKEDIRYVNPNNVQYKMLTTYFRNKRHHLLNELHRMDRERYEILVSRLKIDHKPTEPGIRDATPIHRKPTLRQLTREYCDSIRKERMEAYHEKLKAQQEAFLKEKEETLEWIKREMEKYSITEEDVRTEFRLRDKYRDPPVKRVPVSS